MFKIGNVIVDGKVVLGPMAGYTSVGYRKYMKKFGVSLSFTEMVSDMGLIYGNIETFSYLLTDEHEGPLGLQLFGFDAENLQKAARIAEENCKYFDFFDINVGCPVPKVTKTGAGSALMKTPEKIGEIIRAIKAVSNKPVSIKIRLGWDNSNLNYLEVIKIAEEAGVDLISIHARAAKEYYNGEPHFELLKDLREKMSVPLVISGNIFSLDDAINALEVTKADAVMVARGSIGNPFLIRQIDEYLRSGTRLSDPTLEEQKQYCLELARSIIEEKGEFMGMRLYRSIAPKFFSGFANSKALRKELAMNLSTYEYLEKVLADFKG